MVLISLSFTHFVQRLSLILLWRHFNRESDKKRPTVTTVVNSEKDEHFPLLNVWKKIISLVTINLKWNSVDDKISYGYRVQRPSQFFKILIYDLGSFPLVPPSGLSGHRIRMHSGPNAVVGCRYLLRDTTECWRIHWRKLIRKTVPVGWPRLAEHHRCSSSLHL